MSIVIVLSCSSSSRASGILFVGSPSVKIRDASFSVPFCCDIFIYWSYPIFFRAYRIILPPFGSGFLGFYLGGMRFNSSFAFVMHLCWGILWYHHTGCSLGIGSLSLLCGLGHWGWQLEAQFHRWLEDCNFLIDIYSLQSSLPLLIFGRTWTLNATNDRFRTPEAFF